MADETFEHSIGRCLETIATGMGIVMHTSDVGLVLQKSMTIIIQLPMVLTKPCDSRGSKIFQLDNIFSRKINKAWYLSNQMILTPHFMSSKGKINEDVRELLLFD